MVDSPLRAAFASPSIAVRTAVDTMDDPEREARMDTWFRTRAREAIKHLMEPNESADLESGDETSGETSSVEIARRDSYCSVISVANSDDGTNEMDVLNKAFRQDTWTDNVSRINESDNVANRAFMQDTWTERSAKESESSQSQFSQESHLSSSEASINKEQPEQLLTMGIVRRFIREHPADADEAVVRFAQFFTV